MRHIPSPNDALSITPKVYDELCDVIQRARNSSDDAKAVANRVLEIILRAFVGGQEEN
jgi:hypothetical protein